MPFQIIPPGTRFDFIGKWRIALAASLSVVLLGAIAAATLGIRWGLDFAGGAEAHLRFTDSDSSEGAIREVLSGLDLESPSVVRYGEGAREFLIKFRGERARAAEGEAAEVDTGTAGAAAEAAAVVSAETDRVLALQRALSEQIGPLEVIRTEYVGPRVGAELREDGLNAILLACLLILIYIAFRFSMRFAPGAVIALVHDVLITCSLWLLLGLEFDLRVLAALLAIIGYSLNDTIIVYDRIRENLEMRTGAELPEVLNRSVNQTLSRTVLTSITTLLALLSLLLLGGEVVRPFALAMAMGVVVGTYSSVYIAAPTLMWLESRFRARAESGRPAGA